MMSFESRNCSGSVRSGRRGGDEARLPAAEQMVRSRRQCAQAMEKTPVHAGPLASPWFRHSCRAGSLPGRIRCDTPEAVGDCVQGFVPGDALESALTFRAGAPLRIEQAIGRIFAFQILRDFAAEESARNGMIGIAAKLRPTPFSTLISREQPSGQSSAHTECSTGTRKL